jgi:SAM-dependent methyltransferase
MIAMEYTLCAVCGSSDTSQLFTLPDYLLDRKDVQATFVRCQSCGLVYQNPRPTPDEMSQHYPPEYESYSTPDDTGNASWLLQQAIQLGLRKRGRFITRHKQSGRLLDIGCATGFFLNGMRAQGQWDLYGVEISPYAARVAQEKYGLNVRIGTLEDAAFPDNFFDVVTLWDVLEHLHEPVKSLQEIHRVLKPDGLLVFRVPNLASLDARLFGPFWAGLDPPRHLYVFSPRTVETLLHKTGFSSLEQSSASGNYPTFLLSVRFWLNGREFPSRQKALLTTFLYHPVMRILSGPIFYLRSGGLRGPQMIVIGKKATDGMNG